MAQALCAGKDYRYRYYVQVKSTCTGTGTGTDTVYRYRYCVQIQVLCTDTGTVYRYRLITGTSKLQVQIMWPKHCLQLMASGYLKAAELPT